MKVSVIVPFHKGKAFLKDCFDSLVEQNYDDMEIILVCDNVTEHIKSIIKEYKDKLLIRKFKLEEKTGVAAARNLGIEMAEGEFIYFLDSDDYLFEDAIKIIVDRAEETQANVVYSKTKGTWYKRSVYLAELAEKMAAKNSSTEGNDETEENNDEDNEGEFDASELDAIDEEDEQAQEVEEIIDIETKLGFMSDEERELYNLKEARKLDKRHDGQMRRAAKILISSRRGIKNVSVLGLLVKRDIYINNNIRFNEEFKYYSDLSVVIQIICYGESFAKTYSSKYIKRKHNDPINLPALSQLKDEYKFAEYVAAYRYTRELIPDDKKVIRSRLDKKVVNYYTNYFVTRVKRSENDYWRKERFDVMRELMIQIKETQPDALKKLGDYKTKLIYALLDGKVDKTLMITNSKLGKDKAKAIMKNKNELGKYLYYHMFSTMPIKENYIMFESFFGKSYSDSPKYISEYLNKNYPGKYKFVWVLNENKSKVPYNVIKVKRFSVQYMYYLGVCKYFVFNGRQPAWFRKREGTIFLETWHGTPLKKLVFDQEDVCGATPQYKKQVYKQTRAWDYLVAPNEFSHDTFKRCFMYDKEMLNTGYPRNDILHYPNKDEIAKQLKSKLGIPSDKKTILYAPTWRDDEYYEKGKYKFELKMDLKMMREQLGENYVVLLRTHYFIADSIDTTGIEDFAYNLSKYDDISEIYLISDILITDYSSVFFDYANLKRPMLFFTYDLDKYRDVLRGFYIDMEKEIPGPLVFTTEEIIETIKNIDNIKLEYKEKYDIFYEKFCGWEDGTASKKVCERVFKE